MYPGPALCAGKKTNWSWQALGNAVKSAFDILWTYLQIGQEGALGMSRFCTTARSTDFTHQISMENCPLPPNFRNLWWANLKIDSGPNEQCFGLEAAFLCQIVPTMPNFTCVKLGHPSGHHWVPALNFSAGTCLLYKPWPPNP